MQKLIHIFFLQNVDNVILMEAKVSRDLEKQLLEIEANNNSISKSQISPPPNPQPRHLLPTPWI